MADHAAVRAGDERATFELLQRLARQAAVRGNYPPPSRGNGWTADDVSDLIGDVFEHKAGFLDKAFVETTDDGGLERYLLRVFENRLRDQARQTQRGKLIDRLKTLLNKAEQFVRRPSPPAWRTTGSPDIDWQGDIGELIAATRDLRGLAIAGWTHAGPLPAALRKAVINVCDAALEEAAGFVRDPDVADVVYYCIPAIPREAWHAETAAEEGAHGELEGESLWRPREAETPAAAEVAGRIWTDLTEEERRAFPHLDNARQVERSLGVGKRAATALVASVKEKVRRATTDLNETDVSAALGELLDQAAGTNPSEGGVTS
ncbi:hypothetical protein [uncultured Nocardioides sp.]|uniref:hypothetical protein n=1 Tax=uncultured Nocardioides sp. TaxID=198441 RepID=UPI000C3A5C73|nr:hypothetical protein [Nocardioides sp.]|tara:strand:+ start:2647 stop:3603 length:957 start_codon:yes stop_codon:yes gene_type:complete